jgi:hypothetical protein
LNVNTKFRIKHLSDEDLVAVAGGMKNAETAAFQAFWSGLVSTCGPEGQKVLAGSVARALDI